MLEQAISVVVPIFNEEGNIPELHKQINGVLEKDFSGHEIIYVDDGSRDTSFSLLEKLAKEDSRVRVIKFTRNFGQTAALSAGIEQARHETIVTLDGDLQNDPSDIPALVARLDEGYDVVCGWRKYRKDPLISRKVPSWVANLIIAWFSGVFIHDYGCTLKAFRSRFIKLVHLYGEMHRFIPALVHREGGRIVEMAVQHHPRVKGKSNYGMERVFKVVLDLFVLKFLVGYSTRPIHFFGKMGFFCLAASGAFGLYALWQALFGSAVGLLPILFAMFFFLLGFFSILMGLMAELCIRIYYESQDKKPYVVETVLNGDL